MKKSVIGALSSVLTLSGFALAGSETAVSFVINGNKTVMANYVVPASVWSIYSNYFLAALSALVVVAVIYISSKSKVKKKSVRKTKRKAKKK